MSEEGKFFKEMARKDLLSFAVYCDRNFEIENHHKLIADHLAKVLTGEIQNLIIEMPPRAGKSRIMQEFIAKVYGDNPNTDILYTGHSLNLLEGFSRNIRNRINSREYKSLYDTQISSESSAVKNWNIDKGGEFAIYGVGGGITGKGGDILVIDDPYASRQDAESDTVQRTVSDWYWSTLITRKQDDKSKQIIIMQRWKEDDLVGEILEREGGKWTELKIPALDDNDESFWPTRFSAEYFKEIRKSNPLFFSSQYQQDPVNEGGGSFRKEYFQYYENKPTFKRIYTFVDPAISKKQDADFSAIVTIGITATNDIYILDIFRGRVEPDELIENIIRISERFKPNTIGIETVQFQKMLALELRKQMKMRNKMTHIFEMKPTGEKEARIKSTLQPRYSLMSMYHNHDLENINELEMELLKFPNGKHDDMIDSLASCIAMANIEYDHQEEVIKRIDPILDDDEEDDEMVNLSPY